MWQFIKTYYMIFLILVLFLLFFTDPVKRNSAPSDQRSVKRIVSLSPSITRQIVDLGKEALLVGVTSFHPPLNRDIAIIGTLTQPNIERIVTLEPDIVVCSSQDNAVQAVEMLELTGITTYTFEENDSFATISKNYLALASLLRVREFAEKNLARYTDALRGNRPDLACKPRVALLVSHQPLIGVSGQSYIGTLIEDAGGENTMKLLEKPYPLLSLEHLVMLDPDIVISIMHNGVSKDNTLQNILQAFPELKVWKKQSFYTMEPDFVCYYTPRDYVEAQSYIAAIIKKEVQVAYEQK